MQALQGPYKLVIWGQHTYMYIMFQEIEVIYWLELKYMYFAANLTDFLKIFKWKLAKVQPSPPPRNALLISLKKG